MNPEVFRYSILVAVLGMSIVFSALVLLSLMMVAIKGVFGERTTSGAGARQRSEARVVQGNTPTQTGETERWLVAAAVAFLSEEALESHRSAEAWRPAQGESIDPWVNLPRA